MSNEHLSERVDVVGYTKCPECMGKGCGFCTGRGEIAYYPSTHTVEHITIAHMEWRIKNKILEDI